MSKSSWVDPKEALVGLDGLNELVQQLHEQSRVDANNTCTNSVTSNTLQINEHQLNMNIDERTNILNENQNTSIYKRGRNFVDGDCGIRQSPKNGRTTGGLGNKDKNGRGPIVIRNQNYHRNDLNERKNNNQSLMLLRHIFNQL